MFICVVEDYSYKKKLGTKYVLPKELKQILSSNNQESFHSPNV